MIIILPGSSALMLPPDGMKRSDERGAAQPGGIAACPASVCRMTSRQRSSLRRHAPDMSWDYE